MRYFVCTIGGFGEYSDQIVILKECLSKNIYELHRDARWPSPLDHIQKGDTLLLKIQNQLVAWGIAKGPFRKIDPDDYNDGWIFIVEVEFWKQYDPKAPASGVHHYGIQSATMSGAGQFAVVKEVEASWAEEKLEAFQNTALPLINRPADCEEVTCCQLSLRSIFSEPLDIPDYQRCFCWRKENVIDLLETLRSRVENGSNQEETPDTHFGTIILKRDGDKFSIVDGQQRLLTLTILAFCIQKRRIKPRENEKELPLPLLNASLKGTSNDAYSARKHLYWAMKSIDEWLTFTGLLAVPEKLERMLISIQFCVVILPRHASEDLAYTFFNAVNSSGKKLSDYELLKAHHLRFIPDASIAEGMAQCWDSTGAEGYDDILHKTLYRLRTWSRHENPAVDALDGHKLFDHFSAKAPTIRGVFFPPLAVRFNSAIHGGAPFFHFAEQQRLLSQAFQETDTYKLLTTHLSGHSGDVLRHTIGALLFLFYCKFGSPYLDDALFCIAEVISILRNKDRVGAYTIREFVIKDCLFSLDTALDPGQFFEWCLSPGRRYNQNVEGLTRQRYWEARQDLYESLQKRPMALRKQCGQRKDGR
ncbi:MAG: DUF262 domain-containing protein [Terracidiphilus sp.]|jgi:hypothetical protein